MSAPRIRLVQRGDQLPDMAGIALGDRLLDRGDEIGARLAGFLVAKIPFRRRRFFMVLRHMGP